MDKVRNFRNFIEEELIEYVNDELIDNALINLGMIDTLPEFVVLAGLRGVFRKDYENSIIIRQIAEDYFFDLDKLTPEQYLKINKYCDFFKMYL